MNKFVTTALQYCIGGLLIFLIIEIVYFNIFQNEAAIQATNPFQLNHTSSASIKLIGPEEEFLEIITRPLFIWNRKPVLSDEGVQDYKISDIESRWQLSGVIVDRDVSYALFSAVNGGEHLKLERGMKLENWQVDSIEGQQVLLSRDSEVAIMILKRPALDDRHKTRKTRLSKRKRVKNKTEFSDLNGKKKEGDK